MGDFKIGDRVMLDRSRDWEAEMPAAARSAFIHAQFNACPIAGFTDEGLAILDLTAADAELGGKFNDLRVEPASLNLVITVPSDPEALAAFDPSAFALVAGFRLVLRDTETFGKHLDMEDGAGRRLAGFPWWDHVEADIPVRASRRFPLGAARRPHRDMEQGWQLLIWEKGGFVFIAEGRDDHGRDEYDLHFKVPLARYLSEWERISEECKPTQTCFDDLDDAAAHSASVRTLVLESGLRTLPDAVRGFTNLEVLRVARGLEILPEWLGELTRLRELLLDSNKLREIPGSLSRLENLETAYLYSNRLTAVPAFAYTAPRLKDLSIHKNPIPEEEIEKLRKARPELSITWIPPSPWEEFRALFPLVASELHAHREAGPDGDEAAARRRHFEEPLLNPSRSMIRTLQLLVAEVEALLADLDARRAGFVEAAGRPSITADSARAWLEKMLPV